MGAKVTFHPDTRIIQVDSAPVPDGPDMVVDLDVLIELYSDGKQDWLSDADLNKLQFAFGRSGGDPLPGSKELGATFFLENNWKIRPYEATHVFRINGNLYSRDGSSPIIPTVGAYNVIVINTVSNLTDATIQQLPEIEHASYNNQVTIDTVGGQPGTAYPIGTPKYPCDNLADAISIASTRGFKRLFFDSDFTFGPTVFISDFCLCGKGLQATTFTFQYGSICANCSCVNATVTGSTLGINHFEDCFIDTYGGNTPVQSSATIILRNCLLGGVITLPDDFLGTVKALDCWTAEAVDANTAVFDMQGAGCKIVARNLAGALIIRNCSDSQAALSVDMNSGLIVLENTVTGGTVTVRGIGELKDSDGKHILHGTWNGATIDNEFTGQMVEELYELQALNKGIPLNITPTSRKAGDIDLQITGDGEASTTVTRQ